MNHYYHETQPPWSPPQRLPHHPPPPPPWSPPQRLPHHPSFRSSSASITNHSVVAYNNAHFQQHTTSNPKGAAGGRRKQLITYHEITEFDVLFKAHKAGKMNEGNRRYLQIVQAHLEQFSDAFDQYSRRRVMESVFRAVQSQGGRFLTLDTAGEYHEEDELWVEADKKVAIQKTQQRFRYQLNKLTRGELSGIYNEDYTVRISSVPPSAPHNTFSYPPAMYGQPISHMAPPPPVCHDLAVPVPTALPGAATTTTTVTYASFYHGQPQYQPHYHPQHQPQYHPQHHQQGAIMPHSKPREACFQQRALPDNNCHASRNYRAQETEASEQQQHHRTQLPANDVFRPNNPSLQKQRKEGKPQMHTPLVVDDDDDDVVVLLHTKSKMHEQEETRGTKNEPRIHKECQSSHHNRLPPCSPVNNANWRDDDDDDDNRNEPCVVDISAVEDEQSDALAQESSRKAVEYRIKKRQQAIFEKALDKLGR